MAKRKEYITKKDFAFLTKSSNKIVINWCGQEDLNLHEVAPTRT
jgi:hypothetical protein